MAEASAALELEVERWRPPWSVLELEEDVDAGMGVMSGDAVLGSSLWCRAAPVAIVPADAPCGEGQACARCLLAGAGPSR
jgi:hypothetical protein